VGASSSPGFNSACEILTLAAGGKRRLNQGLGDSNGAKALILAFMQGPYLAAGVFALIYLLSVIQSLKTQGKTKHVSG
jgi:hypothetical protein